MKHVSFIRMDQGTAEDYAFLNALEDEFVVALPDRLLAALASLEGSLAGYQINRLEHSLQSATRAEACLLYTSPSPRDATLSRMPSSA